MILPTRSQLIRDSALTKTDLLEIATCPGEPQRLGFAYQLGFVRAFQRFPVQQPLEVCEELLSFVALQTGIDGSSRGRINARELPDVDSGLHHLLVSQADHADGSLGGCRRGRHRRDPAPSTSARSNGTTSFSTAIGTPSRPHSF